jgi:ABC-type lipoprotein release transport system permease subunit
MRHGVGHHHGVTLWRRETGAAIGMWARSEVRSRWKALVALGVIGGLAAGVGLAAIAGARRTGSAYARWQVATAAPDAIVFGTQLGQFALDYGPVIALPEVVDAGRFSLSPLAIKGSPLGSLPPADDHLYRTLSKPLLAHGRLPDPARADEIIVNREAASKTHLRVGQRVTLLSANRIEAFFGQAPMEGGPTVEARVVGVGDSMLDLIFNTSPSFTPSGGFLAHAPEVPQASNLVVRLRPGTSVAAFRAHAAAALGLPDIPIRALADDRKRVQHATDLERTALLLFAAAVAVAAVVMVGQAVTRAVAGMAEPVPVLQAMGLTRQGVVAGLTAPMAVAAAVAVVVAVGAACALSPRFPVGLAGRLDPDVGLHADWTVFVAGATVVVALVLGGSMLAAWRAAGAAQGRDAIPRRAVVTRFLRTHAPLPVGIGAGLALEPGRGERAVPVRPAIAGAVAGILGVVGAFGLVRGIDDAVANPQRSGQVWDAVVWPNTPDLLPGLVASLKRDADVRDVMDMVRMPVDVDGSALPVYALDPVRGNAPFVVLHGRGPRTDHEVAIGPASATALHKRIGDSLHVSGTIGADVRIVGTVLLPQTPHSSFDQGIWVTRSRLGTLVDLSGPGVEEVLPVTARSGLKPAALVARLGDRLHTEIDTIDQPQDVVFLSDVRTLPRALAAFLALLGIAATAHALATAVRRRRRDFAVLRTLGFRPGQNAAVIASQASTVALLGLVIGLPFGLAAGRVSWQWVADSTPLLYVPPVATVAAIAIVPVAIVLANALAAWPARQAARLRPADALRAE